MDRVEVATLRTFDRESESPTDSNSAVKVVFMVERQDDEWPPVSSEGLWAEPVADNEYILDNVPWFVRGVACGDRVMAEPDADGVLRVQKVISWSGRYTIRVIPLLEEPLHERLQEVIDRFSALGADCEGALPSFAIVALDIPPTARVAEIKALLDHGETEGWWSYDEGCIDDVWRAL